VIDDPSGLTAPGAGPVGAPLGTRTRRRTRVPRAAIGGSLALVAAGALAAGVVGIHGLVSGGGTPTVAADPPRLDLAPALRAIAAAGDGWSDYLATARAAERARQRAVAKERRRRDLARIRREERRRAEALAANQVVSAPAPAPADSAPAESTPESPANPWAGVSPMVRATTPGPWNGGGASS
jgi:hypothetical protein